MEGPFQPPDPPYVAHHPLTNWPQVLTCFLSVNPGSEEPLIGTDGVKGVRFLDLLGELLQPPTPLRLLYTRPR